MRTLFPNSVPAAALAATLFLVTLTGCRTNNASGQSSVSAKNTNGTGDLASARKAFQTTLLQHGPAPQPYQNEAPPTGVREVTFPSGKLALKGWLSDSAKGSEKRPAVVFLHGGWAFGGGDWDDAAPFMKAGYVVFMPRLRGENGGPGEHESFYGEADDAVAAGKYVAALRNVDGKRVFVVGHSIGGVLTCLTAMLPSPYRAAASYDGYVDMESWAAQSPAEAIPYDRNNPDEVRLRNPLAFAPSLKIPLHLYVGDSGRSVNAVLADAAKQAGKDCELIDIGGEHHEMVAPAVQQSITWFNTFN